MSLPQGSGFRRTTLAAVAVAIAGAAAAGMAEADPATAEQAPAAQTPAPPASAAPLALGQAPAESAPEDQRSGPQNASAQRSGPPLAAAVQGYRIDDWKALSSEALTIRTNDGRRYRATLMGKCIGLRFTDTIAFVTRGERTVDRFAGIMLPDGSRCYFKTFEAISQPTDSREPRRP